MAREVQEAQRIRFLHIPKTAGTSFANCLRRVYKANRLKRNIFVFLGDFEEDLRRYRQLRTEERDNLRVVSGHAPLITGERDIDNLPTITFLRNPVDRVKSLCQYVNDGKDEKVRGWVDIDAFLADHRNVCLHNLQTRTLLGVGNYDLPNTDEDSMVERALDMLEKRMVSFGITEQFEDSLMLFKIGLGWTGYPVYTRLNEAVRKKSINFTPSQIERIKALNSIDIRVYSAALEIFRSRMRSRLREIEQELSRFSIRQRFAQPLLSCYRLYHAGRVLLARMRTRRIY